MKPGPDTPHSPLPGTAPEKMQAEDALRDLNRKLRAISNCNQTLLRATDENVLLGEICRIVCDEAGYRMAWVGLAEHNEARTVRPAAWAGAEDGYLASATISSADTGLGRGPAGTAVRTGKSTCVQDLAADANAGPWREAALQHGYHSAIALPLKDEHAVTFGALTIYSSEPEAFTPDEIRLLEELAGDLAFGITVLRGRDERRRAEEQLRHSEQSLAEAQHIARLGNWELDLVSGKLTWSDEIYRIFEIDPREFGASYEAFLNAIHPDDRERVNKAYSDSIRDKVSYDIVHRLRMPDGRIKFVHERCRTFFENGQPVRSVGTVQDITEGRQADEALRASEEKYRTLIQKLQAAVVVHAADTRIVTCNPVAQTLLGLTEDQLLGKTAVDPAWHFFREDGTAMPQDEYPVNQVLATRQPVRNQVLGVHRPGCEQDVWAMVNASPVFGRDGGIAEIIVTFIDITQRRRTEEALRASEEELRALVAAMTDVVFVINREGRYLKIPETSPSLLYKPATELRGKTLHEVFPKAQADQFLTSVSQALATQRPVNIEYNMGIGDTDVWFDATISPMSENAAVVVARNNTDRKRAEEALRESEERYRLVFENSPVSIWEEDFSGVRAFFDGLKKEGISDLETYFAQHPEAVRHCVELAEIVDVNRAAVALHRAANKAELLAGLVNTFTPESFEAFRQELVCLWNGGNRLTRDAVVKTLGGELRHVTVYFSICPGYEPTLARVLVSLADITEKKQAEEALQKLNLELDQRVKDRTSELEAKNRELERVNRLFVGREMRMVELKKRISELERSDPARLPADGVSSP